MRPTSQRRAIGTDFGQMMSPTYRNPFLAKPTATKISQVSSDRKIGMAIRLVIGKLIPGVTSKRLAIRMNMNIDRR